VKKWAHELNREFSKEEIQMASKYMKRCSTSLFIKDMQIRTILRFHLTPVRMARIRNTKDTCFLSRMEDRSNDKHTYKTKHDHMQIQM
jgi:hypothetical protein